MVLSNFNTQFESVGIDFGNRNGFNILYNVRALKKVLLFNELFILDPPLLYFFFQSRHNDTVSIVLNRCCFRLFIVSCNECR